MSTTIGTIGNYYGCLSVMKENDKFYWGIENWDGTAWEEITEELYNNLIYFEEKRASLLFFHEKDEDILKQVSSSYYFTNYYDYSENECKHPKEQRTFIGSNLLRCGVCGEEFS